MRTREFRDAAWAAVVASALLVGTIVAVSAGMALLGGCASTQQREITAAYQSDEPVSGWFEVRDPLRILSLQEAIEVCEEFCASRQLTVSDTYWANKGKSVGCCCSCRKIEKGHGPPQE